MRSIGITSEGSSTTQISDRSRDASEQIRQRGPSARLKQTSQSPTFSFTSRIAVGERLGLVVLGAQEVEGEPLRGPLADAGQPRELGDEPAERGRALALTARGAPRGRPAIRPPSRPGDARPSSSVASSWAERIASLTAAMTMSESISASSGSIASGSISIPFSFRSPLIVTLTMPPPALASTVLVGELLLRLDHLGLHLLRLLEQRVHVQASGAAASRHQPAPPT